MAVKVVQGLIGKPELETKSVQSGQSQSSTAQSSSTYSHSGANQRTLSSAIKNTDAVISTLRSFRSRGVSSDTIKDPKEAERTAVEVSERIRGDREEAGGAHSGLSSGKSAPVLVN